MDEEQKRQMIKALQETRNRVAEATQKAKDILAKTSPSLDQFDQVVSEFQQKRALTEAHIEKRLREYLQSESPDPNGYRIAARELNAVPVYETVAGFLGICPSGDVVLLDKETGVLDLIPDDSSEIVDKRGYFAVLMAYREAVTKYPELKGFVIERPDDALSCSKCNGSGACSGDIVHPVEKFFQRTICNDCGGLGWTSPGC